VLVLRDVTERPEGVRAGVSELVGTDGARIVERARAHLAAPQRPVSDGSTPYGDGQAGARIADLVIHHLTGAPRRTLDWDPEGADP
jgi:UDP-N-acetylglucosamine 2-epimerase (non-hydrolysing)